MGGTGGGLFLGPTDDHVPHQHPPQKSGSPSLVEISMACLDFLQALSFTGKNRQKSETKP